MARPALVKSGIVVIFASIVAGVSPTVIGMIRAFNETANYGSVEVGQVKESVGTGMMWTFWSMPAVVIGFVLLVAGMFMRSKPKVDGFNQVRHQSRHWHRQ